MSLSSLGRPLAALGLLLAFASQAAPAFAGTSGGIAGIVTDAKTGAPIAGVRLEISSPSQSTTVTTDARGHFIAFALQPDNYTVTAVKSGYETQSVDGYSVYADQTQLYDFSLQPAEGS